VHLAENYQPRKGAYEYIDGGGDGSDGGHERGFLTLLAPGSALL
jgi:hypothetical protein